MASAATAKVQVGLQSSSCSASYSSSIASFAFAAGSCFHSAVLASSATTSVTSELAFLPY